MQDVALLLVALALASGQASKRSDAERQAILDYQLTLPRANQLIAAMEAMTKYVASLPDFAQRMRKAMTQTRAQGSRISRPIRRPWPSPNRMD